VKDVVARTKTLFAGWTQEQKDDHCAALVSPSTASIAWDIRELHRQEWIQRYRPDCATPCSAGDPKKPCGSFPGDPGYGRTQASVQIDSSCHYAGSVNYVIFGVMCKLCDDNVGTLTKVASGVLGGLAGEAYANRFSRSAMLLYIWKYKSESPNYEPSKQWAVAGFDGWPSGPSTPGGDRTDCTTTCPLTYGSPVAASGASLGTGAFQVHWNPAPGTKYSDGWY
jgi:hypothetical protein